MEAIKVNVAVLDWDLVKQPGCHHEVIFLLALFSEISMGHFLGLCHFHA